MNFIKADKLYEWTIPSSSLKQDGIYLLGIEFDGTACFRKGAARGPNAIRDVSSSIESFSPYLNLDLEDFNNLYDLGNIDIPKTENIESNWRKATDFFLKKVQTQDLKQGSKLLTLGGEHSVSYAPIRKYLETFENLALIHLDAHADLRDGYEGYHYSHASIIRRALDHFGPNHSLLQYGIRSGTKEEYKWMREHKTAAQSLEEFILRVEEISDDREIYLTLDLDYFDPAYLPGTGTPEPGGESFHSFIKLLKILKTKNLVGADVVELAPSIDPTGNSSVFAAKVVRELLMVLHE